MGVLNVTPDSFSDGGAFLSPARAVERAIAMVEQGADIIDIGGESSRPGAEPVSTGIELERVVPVVEALRAASDVCISVDTTKSVVAEAAVTAGADVINDITALTGDPMMAEVARRTGAGVVLMHMRGRPSTMQQGDLSSPDRVGEICAYLAERVEALVEAGIAREALCVDPGIGFGKTVEQNLQIIAQIPRVAALGLPVLIGASRKSFLGAITGRAVEHRLAGTAAACTLSVQRGAHILRVHDVAEMVDVVAVAEAIGAEGPTR